MLSDSEERDALDRADLIEGIRGTIEERDDSNVFAELLDNTRARLRFNLGYNLTPDSWSWDAAQIEDAMHEIATAAGIDYDVNEKALRSLVAEATLRRHPVRHLAARHPQ